MLFSHVFATCKSRPALLAPLSFLPFAHSSLFFSEVCSLFFATAVSQPFAYQSLRHSFHRDGGCTSYPTIRLFNCSPIRLSHLDLCPFARLSREESTLMKSSVSVATKELTGSLNPLDATLTKNRGVGDVMRIRQRMRILSPPTAGEPKDSSPVLLFARSLHKERFTTLLESNASKLFLEIAGCIPTIPILKLRSRSLKTMSPDACRVKSFTWRRA